MDPAVLLEDAELPPPPELEPREGPVVAACPCWGHGIGSRKDAPPWQWLADCLDRLCRETGCFIRLLVMNGSQVHGDRPACEAIARALPPERVEIMPYDPNPMFAFRVLQQSDLVIGMRLHAIVFAYAAGVPFVALSYHPKVRDFAEVVGLSQNQIFEPEQWDSSFLTTELEAILARPKSDTLAAVPVSEAQRAAKAGFEELAQAMA